MLKCRKENSTANPSKPALVMDCRVKPGNDDTENYSRDALRVRVLPSHSKKERPCTKHPSPNEQKTSSSFVQ
jgi:hypothetical protein